MQKDSKIQSALNKTIQAEDDAVRKRFEKADTLLEKKPSDSTSSKVIRDSFTFPKKDHDLIDVIKSRCLNNRANASKSEIIRAGLFVLAGLSDQELLIAIDSLEKLKLGRQS